MQHGIAWRSVGRWTRQLLASAFVEGFALLPKILERFWLILLRKTRKYPHGTLWRLSLPWPAICDGPLWSLWPSFHSCRSPCPSQPQLQLASECHWRFLGDAVVWEELWLLDSTTSGSSTLNRNQTAPTLVSVPRHLCSLSGCSPRQHCFGHSPHVLITSNYFHHTKIIQNHPITFQSVAHKQPKHLGADFILITAPLLFGRAAVLARAPRGPAGPGGPGPLPLAAGTVPGSDGAVWTRPRHPVVVGLLGASSWELNCLLSTRLGARRSHLDVNDKMRFPPNTK